MYALYLHPECVCHGRAGHPDCPSLRFARTEQSGSDKRTVIFGFLGQTREVLVNQCEPSTLKSIGTGYAGDSRILEDEIRKVKSNRRLSRSDSLAAAGAPDLIPAGLQEDTPSKAPSLVAGGTDHRDPSWRIESRTPDNRTVQQPRQICRPSSYPVQLHTSYYEPLCIVQSTEPTDAVQLRLGAGASVQF